MAQIRDEWFSRDEPVLHAIAEALQDPHGGRVSTSQLAGSLGWRQELVNTAITALTEGDPYVRARGGWGGWTFIEGLTERGKRHVGVWPSDDDTQAFIQALEAAAIAEADPEQKSKIRSVLEGVRDMGTKVTGEVLAAYAKAHLGI